MPGEVNVTRVSRNSGPMLGPLWVMGWLFAIGYLKLSFWKGVLAIVLWPYYLGAFLHK
jgi:uncharacterized membrane protein